GGGGTRGAGRFYGAITGQGAGRGGGETTPRRKAYGVHMIQTPMPPMPPGLDPNFVFNQVMPLIAVVVVVLVGATAVRWILRGTPVGEVIAERIRMRAQRRWGGGGAGEDPQRVAALGAGRPGEEGRRGLGGARRAGGAGSPRRPGEAGAAAAQRACAGRPAAARHVDQAPRGNGQAQGLAAPAQRSDRRSQAQEEH